MGAAAVLGALEMRRRTGSGAHIDVSQYECGLLFLAGPLFDYHQSGTIALPAGNSDPEAVPHGAYPCVNGGWVALSCWSEAEFAALAAALGRPELAVDRRFETVAGRRNCAGELDAEIGRWTRERDAGDATRVLQQAGVHAHQVNSIADLYTDPQLLERRQWRRRRHPVIGDQAYCYPAFELADTPGDITAAGPVLGADNDTVFGEFLGLSGTELEAHQAAGAFG